MKTVELKHENILLFLTGGKAIFTILNEKTGNRFTFKIKAATDDAGKKNREVQFVKVLTDQCNSSDTCYQFLGTIFTAKSEYRHGKRAKITEDAQSSKVFKWLWATLSEGKELPTFVKVFHEGMCGCCGKKLTVPESILTGFGPYCYKQLTSN